MSYDPETIERRLGILTRGGWLTGSLSLPRACSLPDYLQAQEFLPLTAVQLPHQDHRLPFLTLHREAILFVSTPDVASVHYDPPPKKTTECVVACLFEDALLIGSIDVQNGRRPSDFLQDRTGFFPLRECTVTRESLQLGAAVPSRFDLVLVNTDQLVGLSEASETAALSQLSLGRGTQRASSNRARYRDV